MSGTTVYSNKGYFEINDERIEFKNPIMELEL